MERTQTLSHLWLIVQTVGWIIALEGVAEYISDRHLHSLFRHFVADGFNGDPQSPRPPDSWEEWYNS